MPLFLPFKRAGVHEQVFQIVVYPITVVMALLVLVPFSMMLALSFGDATDAKAARKWPDLRHFFNKDRMYLHYLATRYDYWTGIHGFDEHYGIVSTETSTVLDMEKIPEPAGKWRVRAKDGLSCLATKLDWAHAGVLYSGWYYWDVGRRHALSAYTGLGDIAWKKYLREKYGNIAAVNAAFGTEFASFAYVKTPGLPGPNSRTGSVQSDPWRAEYCAFVNGIIPDTWRMIYMGGLFYRSYLKELPEVEGDLAKLNALAGSDYSSWSEISLTETVPEDPTARKLWEKYIRETVNPYLLEITVTPEIKEAFRAYLVASSGSEQAFRMSHGSEAAAMELPARAVDCEGSPQLFAAWDGFVRTIPAEALRIVSSEGLWVEFLKGKYLSINDLNQIYGSSYADYSAVPWPQREIDRLEWEKHKFTYVREILFKNYRRVWSLMVDAAPAIINTLRFAVLFTVLALIVDTAAAYALSRFHLGSFQMSLVFFLALAAFPIEAIAVPNFLLLKSFGLLNTVWALVLPTAVNGYYIYLLKGHFDSISKSHIEEAVLHGAGEWCLFWRVSLPMARPMVAVVGLYAFLWAYSNFIWALIVCQQRQEWTMPVLIFNMNHWSPAPMLAAAQIFTLIPPLLVFAFAHRTLQQSLSLPH